MLSNKVSSSAHLVVAFIALISTTTRSANAFFIPAVQRLASTKTPMPTSTSSLSVSVVSDFLTKEKASSDNDETNSEFKNNGATETTGRKTRRNKKMTLKLSTTSTMPISENAYKRSTGSNRRRKHNYQERAHVLQEKPSVKNGSSARNQKKQQKQLQLHSNAISSLNQDTPIDDIVRAIKRARNLHDIHDINVIGNFLMYECNEDWGYGYRGSLLSRLAVAALHVKGCRGVARKAINVRRQYHRSSMLPHESAAIVRGLLRVHDVTDAFEVLEDELSLPLTTTCSSMDQDDYETKEKLKHRALSLASIASRHFYEQQPAIAALACQKLADLGPMMKQSMLTAEDISMPWDRLIMGATECEERMKRNGHNDDNDDDDIMVEAAACIDLPDNLVEECVLSAMETFPYSEELLEELDNLRP